MLLVKMIKVEENQSSSGIIRPESVSGNSYERAEVLAVGAGRILTNGQRNQIEIKVGDLVVYKAYLAKNEIEDGILLLDSNEVEAIETKE